MSIFDPRDRFDAMLRLVCVGLFLVVLIVLAVTS